MALVWQDTPSATSATSAANFNTLASLTESVSTIASSGTAQTIPSPAVVSASTATINDITLTANCTLTFPAATSGTSFLLFLRQDATGSRTVTWPTVKWPAAVVPTLSTAANAIDVVSFICVAGAWYGFIPGFDMR